MRGMGGKTIVFCLGVEGWKGRILSKGLTQVYCVWVNDRAIIRLRLVMDDCCIWACRGDGVERKADKVEIFPSDCYSGIVQK